MNAAVSFGSNVDFKHIHWIYLCISDEQTTGSDKYEPEIDNMVSYHNASTETLYKQMVSENLAEFDSRLVWRESAVNHSGQKRSVTGTCRRIKSKKSLIYLALIFSYTFELIADPLTLSLVYLPASLTKQELNNYYGNKRPKDNDLIIIFQKDGAVIVLDYGQYEQLDIPGKIQGQSVEEVIKSFAEQSQKCSTAGKRHYIHAKM